MATNLFGVSQPASAGALREAVSWLKHYRRVGSASCRISPRKSLIHSFREHIECSLPIPSYHFPLRCRCQEAAT